MRRKPLWNRRQFLRATNQAVVAAAAASAVLSAQSPAKTIGVGCIGLGTGGGDLMNAVVNVPGVMVVAVCDVFRNGHLPDIAEGPAGRAHDARQNPAEDGGKIGPEFTFGLALDAALQEPVLLIKTAWGGKSLYYDFRPPSAGVYPRSPDDIAKNRNPESGSGRDYRLMIEHVKKVLADPGGVCPAYDAAQGYEITGLVWLQGWNDMVDRNVYPFLHGLWRPGGGQIVRF